MASTIKIKNSSTAGAVPTAGDLVQGELAVNVTDKTIFTENASGTVVELGKNYTGFKNRIINGAMMIDQRNAGASVTPTASTTYTMDRWGYAFTQASKASVQQNAGSVTPPVGFANYYGFTSLSAYSVLSSDNFAILQPIEGSNIADLAWGTASAQSVTLSFWVRSSLTGTFGGSLANSGVTRSYPFTYTISSANTWEQKSVTISGDTSGTWLTTNGVGIYVRFGVGVGATYSGAAGAWAAADYRSATGATSVVGTSGATFYITGVQLEKGSTATSFDYRPYGTELALCQRYYWQTPRRANYATSIPPVTAGQAWSSTTASNFVCGFPVVMRSTPTLYQSGLRLYAPFYAVYSATITLASPTSTTGAMLNSSGSTGLTGGMGIWVAGSGNATDYIGFGAEL